MTNVTRDGRDWQPAYLLAIDEKKCIGCGRCFKVCGRDVMTLKGLNEDGELVELDDDEDDEIEKKIMVMNDEGACIGCGACARVCPTNCQTHASGGLTPAGGGVAGRRAADQCRHEQDLRCQIQDRPGHPPPGACVPRRGVRCRSGICR